MNPLLILLWVIIGLALLAAIFVPAAWAIMLLADRDAGDPWPLGRLAAAAAVTVIALTASIWLLGTFVVDDSAAHCGPGTHYLETGSGKTRSWICVAS